MRSLFPTLKPLRKAQGGRNYAPNPMLNARHGFFSGSVDRLLYGWDTASSSIDFYIGDQLPPLRARSREMVRSNPYGKRFIASMKSNVAGHSGVVLQAQTTIFRAGQGETLDDAANQAIESAFADWAKSYADFTQRNTWVDLQNLAISCAAQDGEFIFRKHRTGPYGLQLECIDPETLDITQNKKTRQGVIRLGVEYDRSSRPIRYHFKRPDEYGNYNTGEEYSLDASEVIHGFISEWPDQSRGIPWMHASLERSKHLDKYEEAAIVKARSTAATMAVLRNSVTGDEEYEGDEEYGSATLDQYEPGTIKDIGDKEVTQLDSDYPHQMYADFVKAQLQGIASGLGISYHTISNDLEGVNYSSIRAGVLEDREIFKGLQNWFIRSLIQPVYESWLQMALSRGAIRIGDRPLNRPIQDYMKVHFQPKRWAWVDPQKDGFANELALKHRLKSYSQLMREQGDDPETVWREIERDESTMRRLGIFPTTTEVTPLEPVED